MNDFQNLHQLIDTSVKNSSYITVCISSGVFIIYTLIIKLVDLFKSKDKNKPLMDMASAIKEVSTNVVILNSVLTKTLQNIEKKETVKAKNTIKLGFNSFQNSVQRECTDMIINNHIEENKELIYENVKNLINTEYYKLYSYLSNFEINGSNIALKLEKECIDELYKAIIAIMFNGQDKVTRISQLNSRLTVYTNKYTIRVDNKIFAT